MVPFSPLPGFPLHRCTHSRTANATYGAAQGLQAGRCARNLRHDNIVVGGTKPSAQQGSSHVDAPHQSPRGDSRSCAGHSHHGWHTQLWWAAAELLFGNAARLKIYTLITQ
jgi:hypothetical protein